MQVHITNAPSRSLQHVPCLEAEVMLHLTETLGLTVAASRMSSTCCEQWWILLHERFSLKTDSNVSHSSWSRARLLRTLASTQSPRGQPGSPSGPIHQIPSSSWRASWRLRPAVTDGCANAFQVSISFRCVSSARVPSALLHSACCARSTASDF